MNKNKDNYNLEIKYGLIYGITLILLTISVNYLETEYYSTIASYLALFLPIFIYWFALKNKKKNLKKSFKIRSGIKSGFIVALVTASLVTIYLHFYFQYFNPDWQEKSIIAFTENLKNQNLETEEISRQIKVYSLLVGERSQLIIQFLSLLVEAIIISLGISLLLKHKKFKLQ